MKNIIFWFGDNCNLNIQKTDDEIKKVDRYLRTKNFTGYVELNNYIINLQNVLFYELK